MPMGRPPKPAARQAAEGDPSKFGRKKVEAKAAAEPQASTGYPESPDHLSKRARDAWDFWVPELEVMNIDRRPDAMMLEGACVNYATAVEAGIMVDAEGITVREPILDKNREIIGTKIKNHPALLTRAKCWTLVRAFCSEFGLSPVSRARIHMENNDKEAAEDLAALLTAPRLERPAVQ